MAIERYNEKLMSAISRAAEAMAANTDWRAGIQHLLEEIGQVTGTSRAWIFQTIEMTEDHIVQDYVFEWASAPRFVQLGLQRFHMFRMPLSAPCYRGVIHGRSMGQWQKMIVADIPPGFLHEYLKSQLVRSILTFPIMVNGTWWGTLGFDDCERTHDWAASEVDLLRTASFLVANAILQNELTASQKRFDVIQEITGSGAWEVDLDKKQSRLSNALLRTLDNKQSVDVRGLLSLVRMIHPEDRKMLFQVIRDCIDDGRNDFRADIRVQTDSGNYYWFDIMAQLSDGTNGSLMGVSGVAVDIRARKKHELFLNEIAKTDALTGLGNRRFIDETLKSEMDRAERYSQPLGLMLADIDFFKKLNDKYGHNQGDHVLRDLGEMFRVHFRDVDFTCRYGGEEFAFILPATGIEATKETAERLRAHVEASYFGGLPITLSIGVTALPAIPADGPEMFLNAADQALYKAKRGGRNMVCTPDYNVVTDFKSAG